MTNGKINHDTAVQFAREAIAGKLEVQEGCPVEVRFKGNRCVVTFIRYNPPGVRGPDYYARVTLDARSGKVQEILGPS